jgi:hypothetical protein
MPRGKRAAARPRSETSEGSPLLALPPELLAQVVEHLPVSDRRSVAGTCSTLRALVLSCANRLTLHLGTERSTRAALVAAIRRQHGALHLRLTLGQTITARRLKGELSALGLCPAVQELELAHITVSGLSRHRGHKLVVGANCNTFGGIGSICTCTDVAVFDGICRALTSGHTRHPFWQSRTSPTCSSSGSPKVQSLFQLSNHCCSSACLRAFP